MFCLSPSGARSDVAMWPALVSGGVDVAVFLPGSGTDRQVASSALGGAGPVLLLLAQPVGVSELSDTSGLVVVWVTVVAARAFLEVRDGLEAVNVAAS